VHQALSNEVFFSRSNGNSLSIDDQRVATLYDDHVFIVLAGLSSRRRCLVTLPKGHLASIRAVIYVAFHAGCGLALRGDSVLRQLA
jgi:hypothetical protein